MTTLLDIILVFVAVEAAVIAWRRYARGEASELPGDLANLGAGFGLMVAVRFAWTGSPALLVILFITLAGAAHIFDMMRRFRAPHAPKKRAPREEAPASVSEPDPTYRGSPSDRR